MQRSINDKLKQALNTQTFEKLSCIQSLWSNYGELARYRIDGGKTIIVKHVNPVAQEHPRGWQSHHAHQRKLTSYINEQAFYQRYAHKVQQYAYVPQHLYSVAKNTDSVSPQLVLVLEDLDALGYAQRHSKLTIDQAKLCIDWLASFHAFFMHQACAELSPVACYWHLHTRQDEYHAMPDNALKRAAHDIDYHINRAKFQTLLHGDAKLANFCFDDCNKRVAAVDFQYCGKGLGVRDVCYFIGSICFGDELYEWEPRLRRYYFGRLEDALNTHTDMSNTTIMALLNEYETLYPLCWADFERFLAGWSPEHHKRCAFSDEMTHKALQYLSSIS